LEAATFLREAAKLTYANTNQNRVAAMKIAVLAFDLAHGTPLRRVTTYMGIRHEECPPAAVALARNAASISWVLRFLADQIEETKSRRPKRKPGSKLKLVKGAPKGRVIDV
jgi:hypothetical protein